MSKDGLDSVAQWAKTKKSTAIDHSACWPDGLRTLTGLGSTPGLEWDFQLDWTSGHAMRLNSRKGMEDLPVLFRL